MERREEGEWMAYKTFASFDCCFENKVLELNRVNEAESRILITLWPALDGNELVFSWKILKEKKRERY